MKRTSGRKGKYTPEVVEAICNAIAVHGQDQAGFSAGGINHDTFYRWVKEKPEFADAVDHAKQEWQRSRPDNQVRIAKRALSDLLSGNVIETWTSETTTEVYNAKGELVGTTLSKSVKHVQRAPDWRAIERVLGKPTATLDAVQVLLQDGIATPQQAAIVSAGIEWIENALKESAKGQEMPMLPSAGDRG